MMVQFMHTTLSQKKKRSPNVFSCNSSKHYHFLSFFAQVLLRDWAIKSWFIFPPYLNSVYALPDETVLVEDTAVKCCGSFLDTV